MLKLNNAFKLQMIDLHCHILAGIDDGPETIEESLEMCRIAAADGITTIVATPHYRPGRYEPDAKHVLSKVDELQAAINEEELDALILLGADIAVTPELPVYLRDMPHLTLNKTGRYFLAELPHSHVFPMWEDFIFSLRGKTPILTHPERNRAFISRPESLSSFVRRGGLIQITAMGVTGEMGKEVQEYCVFLLKRGLVHVIASDAHSVSDRRPVLSEAMRKTADIVGWEHAKRLVSDIPRAIIEGKSIELPAPAEPVLRKKRFFGIFG